MSDDPKKANRSRSDQFSERLDSEPSISQRARSTLESHILKPSKPEKTRPATGKNSFKPSVSAQQVTHTPQGQGKDSDRVANLIDQIIEQEEKKKKDAASKSPVQMKSRDLIKVGFALAALGIVGMQVWSQYLASKNQDIRLASRELSRVQREKFENVSADLLSKEIEQIASFLKNSRELGKNKGYLATEIAGHASRANKPSDSWQHLLRCAASSPWSGYNSTNYRKIADDVILLNLGNYLAVYTPANASFQKVFSGFFWQQKVNRVVKKISNRYLAELPQKKFYLEQPAELMSIPVSGHRYFDLQRGSYHVKVAQPYIAGPPILVGDDDRIATLLPQDHKLWGPNLKPDKGAVAFLKNEIVKQTRRYKASEERFKPMLNFDNELNQTKGLLASLGSCQKSAKAYRMPSLTPFIRRAKARITKAHWQVPHIQLTSVISNMGASASMIGMTILQNQDRFTACYRSLKKRTPDGYRSEMVFNLTPTGASANIIAATEKTAKNSEAISRCLTKKLTDLTFPNPVNGKVPKISIALTYQN